jgi:predicted nuclease with RNAse H fold
MISLGIDLAAQAKDTAYCQVQWLADMALAELPVAGADDDALLDVMAAAEWIGIDAPFGWPEPFVRAIGHYAQHAEWPADATPARMGYRETNRCVRDLVKAERGIAILPLSVSSNWIAFCAWRCANLLRLYRDRTGHVLDRIAVPLTSGMDGPPDEPRSTGLVAPRGVIEVYPAAALAMWGLPHKGYKASGNTTPQQARDRRSAILAKLEAEAGGWLVLSDDAREACLDTDHCLDAFVSALVACAAATDDTIKPTLEQRGLAQVEGWIHLPEPASLARLAPGQF